MSALIVKLILWFLPVNLGVSFWVGLREVNQSNSQVSNELEAVGLALLLSMPLISGLLMAKIFPSNGSKLRTFLRFVALLQAALYAPLIAWLNVDSLLRGQALEGDFGVYVLPSLFGSASVILFLVMFLIGLLFTTKPGGYRTFN